MKPRLKLNLLVALAACLFVTPLVVVPTGCTTSQQRVTYNTLYSLETSVTASYDAYLDLVVAGKVDRTKAKDVAVAYNNFQNGMYVAVNAAQFNWSAPTPSNVTALASVVLTTILKAKGQ